jgi:hypothetical protein
MLSVYAVYVTALSQPWQYWVALKHRDRQSFPIKLALPSDAFLVSILDNQRFSHTAREAPKVIPVPLLSIDGPGRPAARTDCLVLIHIITLAILQENHGWSFD